MKNAEIVKALPNLKFLKHESKSIDAQIAGLYKQRDQLNREIRILENVNEVIDGIAVNGTKPSDDRGNIYGKMYRIGAVAAEIERSAEVYPNAHTSKNGIARDWGLKLYGPRKPYGGLDETFLHTGWPYRDAVEIARRWVVYGKVPDKGQQELCLARHKLDPDGNASKRRRLAFEAAWLAGDKKLAETLLVGDRTRAQASEAP